MKRTIPLFGILALLISFVLNTAQEEVVATDITEKPVAGEVAEPAPVVERADPNDLVSVTVNVTGNKFHRPEKLRVILTNQKDIAKQFDFHDKQSWDCLLEVGEWEIRVTAKDYMPHTELFIVTAATTEFHVGLNGATHISGNINDSFGNPLRGQYIFFLTPEQGHPQSGNYRDDVFYARSEPNGKFQSPPLPAGEYYISAGRPQTAGLRSNTSATLLEFERRQAKIVVSDNTLLKIVPNTKLTKQIGLQLQERDEEKSQRPARLGSGGQPVKERDPWERAERLRSTDANEAGEFVLTDLRATEYRLIVEAGKQKYLLETSFHLQVGQPVTVRFDLPAIAEDIKLSEEERAEKKRLRQEQREMGIKPDRGPKYLPLTGTIIAPDFASNLSNEPGVFWK
jgi:hypothetical protein